MAKSDISSAQSATGGALSTAESQGTALTNTVVPGLTNFAQTGGISPEQSALTRQQAQGTVSSIYSSMQNNLNRQRAIQGGYSPGYGANSAQLARQGSASASNAVNQANLGLLQQQTQNQLAGLGGLSNLASMYEGQVPSLLNVESGLAQAKPSWMDLASQGMGLLGTAGSAVAGV